MKNKPTDNLDYSSYYERDEDFLNQSRKRRTVKIESASQLEGLNPMPDERDTDSKNRTLIHQVEKTNIEQTTLQTPPDNAMNKFSPDNAMHKFSLNNSYQNPTGGISMLSQVLGTTDASNINLVKNEDIILKKPPKEEIPIDKIINYNSPATEILKEINYSKTIEVVGTHHDDHGDLIRPSFSLTENYLLQAKRGRGTVLYKNEEGYLEDNQFQRNFEEFSKSYIEEQRLKESLKDDAAPSFEQTLQLKDDYLMTHQRERKKVQPVDMSHLEMKEEDPKKFAEDIERIIQMPEDYYLKDHRSRKRNKVSFMQNSLPSELESLAHSKKEDLKNNPTPSSSESDQNMEDKYLQPDRSGSVFQLPERVFALPEDYYLNQGTRVRKNGGDTRKGSEIASILRSESIDVEFGKTPGIQSFLQMPEDYYLNNQRERPSKRGAERSESLFEAVSRSGSMFDTSSFKFNLNNEFKGGITQSLELDNDTFGFGKNGPHQLTEEEKRILSGEGTSSSYIEDIRAKEELRKKQKYQKELKDHRSNTFTTADDLKLDLDKFSKGTILQKKENVSTSPPSKQLTNLYNKFTPNKDAVIDEKDELALILSGNSSMNLSNIVTRERSKANTGSKVYDFMGSMDNYETSSMSEDEDEEEEEATEKGEQEEHMMDKQPNRKSKKKNKGSSKIKSFFSKVKQFKPFKKKRKEKNKKSEENFQKKMAKENKVEIDIQLITRSVAVPLDNMEDVSGYLIAGDRNNSAASNRSTFISGEEESEKDLDPFLKMDKDDKTESNKKKKEYGKNLVLRNLRFPKFFEELSRTEIIFDFDRFKMEFIGLGMPTKFEIVENISLILFNCGALFIYDSHAKDISNSLTKVPAQPKLGTITSFDIGPDCLSFCVGYSLGAILIFDRLSLKIIKEMYFKNNKSSPILAVKNILFGKKASNIKCELLATNGSGSVEKLRHSKRNIIAAVKHRPIISENETSIYEEIDISQPYHVYKSNRFGLLVSKGDLLVLLLEKQPSIIYKFERLPHFPSQVLPLASFYSRPEVGLNPKEGLNLYPNIVVAWGEVLFTITMSARSSVMIIPAEPSSGQKGQHAEQNVGAPIKKRIPFDISSYAKLDSPAIFIKVLSDNIIAAVVNARGENFLIDLQTDFFAGYPLDFKVLACKPFRPRLYFQKLYDIEAGTKINHNMIRTFQGAGNLETLCYLTDETYKKIKFHEYKDFIMSVWERKFGMDLALKTCAALYGGEFSYIVGVPRDFQERKKHMDEFILKIGEKYFCTKLQAIESQLAGQTPDAQIEKRRNMLGGVINVLVEFFLDCEQDEYLLGQGFRKDYIEKYKFVDKEMLFEALIPFVHINRLKQLPDSTLHCFCDYLLSINDLTSLSNLIIGLDLQIVEHIDNLIEICVNHKLVKGIIYLLTVGENEFTIPLIKLCCIFIDKSIDEATRSDVGIRCQWYFSKCLGQYYITEKPIEYPLWRRVVLELLDWCLIEDNLKYILMMDPTLGFEILYRFFEGEVAKILEEGLTAEEPNRDSQPISSAGKKKKKENQNILKNTKLNQTNGKKEKKEKKDKKNFPETLSVVKVAFQANNSQQLVSKIHESFKALRKSSPRQAVNLNQEKLKASFYVFLARLHSSLKVEISFLMKQKTVIYLMRNPQNISYVRQVNMALDDNIRELEYGKYLEEYILSILEHLKLNEKALEKLIGEAEVSPFASVGSLLNMIKKNYKRCFQLYINSKNKLYQAQIFTWLTSLFGELIRTEGADIELLKDLVKQNLHALVKVDVEKTQNLLASYLKEAENDIIEHLSDNVALQTKYITKILRKTEDYSTVNNDMLLLYLENMCKLKKRRKILYELELHYENYPMEQCINILRKYQIKLAVAFMLEKSGGLMESLKLHIEVFFKYLMKTVNSMKASEPFEKWMYKMKKHIGCLEYTIQRNKNPINRRQNADIIFDYLDWILDSYQKVVKKHRLDPNFSKLLKFYENLTLRSFEEIFKELSTIEGIREVFTKYSFMDVVVIKSVLVKLHQKYRFEIVYLTNINFLFKDWVNIQHQKNLSIYKRAFYISGFCHQCNRELNSESEKTFPCGHVYHLRCSMADDCFVCSNNEINQNIIRGLEEREKRGKSVHSNKSFYRPKNDANKIKKINEVVEEDDKNSKSSLLRRQKLNKLAVHDKRVEKRTQELDGWDLGISESKKEFID